MKRSNNESPVLLAVDSQVEWGFHSYSSVKCGSDIACAESIQVTYRVAHNSIGAPADLYLETDGGRVQVKVASLEAGATAAGSVVLSGVDVYPNELMHIRVGTDGVGRILASFAVAPADDAPFVTSDATGTLARGGQ